MTVVLSDEVASEALVAAVKASKPELVKSLLDAGVVPTRTAFWLANCATLPTYCEMKAVRAKYPYWSLKL
jgi:hypothetical protein